MKHMTRTAALVVTSGLVLGFVTPRAAATVLTFDIFDDAPKTDRFNNAVFIPQSYGDNVSDFSPTGASVEGKYYNYGSAGGFTPNVKVEYRFWQTTDPTNPSPGNNGPPNGLMWDTGYSTLNYVVYNAYGPTWLQEMRLTPDPGYRVTLESFDAAGYLSASGAHTLKILQNANSAVAPFMWSAGPDGTVVFPAVVSNYVVNVSVESGNTLSLLYGRNGNAAVDNIVFSQSLIPEPSSVALLALSGWTLLRWRRRKY